MVYIERAYEFVSSMLCHLSGEHTFQFILSTIILDTFKKFSTALSEES